MYTHPLIHVLPRVNIFWSNTCATFVWPDRYGVHKLYADLRQTHFILQGIAPQLVNELWNCYPPSMRFMMGSRVFCWLQFRLTNYHHSEWRVVPYKWPCYRNKHGRWSSEETYKTRRTTLVNTTVVHPSQTGSLSQDYSFIVGHVQNR